ncbi:MAG: MoaD/ThiS family protein [Thermodesulfobacteriota bacterium]
MSVQESAKVEPGAIKISVVLGGHLRHEASPGPQNRTVELPTGSQVSDLVSHLGLTDERVKIILLNGRAVDPAAPLADGDRIGLFPPELAYNTFVAISFRRKK